MQHNIIWIVIVKTNATDAGAHSMQSVAVQIARHVALFLAVNHKAHRPDNIPLHSAIAVTHLFPVQCIVWVGTLRHNSESF